MLYSPDRLGITGALSHLSNGMKTMMMDDVADPPLGVTVMRTARNMLQAQGVLMVEDIQGTGFQWKR
jgi:hypothetical protein